MTVREELEALRGEFEKYKASTDAFKIMTQAVVQGQAAFDKFTAAVMKAHVVNHAAPVDPTALAEMENARDDVHDAALALE